MFPAIAVYFHHPLTYTDFSGSCTNYGELVSPLSLRGTIALSANAVQNFISVGQNYFSIYTHRGLYWSLHILLHVVRVGAYCMSQWLSSRKCSAEMLLLLWTVSWLLHWAAGSLCSNFLLLPWDSLLTFTLAQYLKSNSACLHWQNVGFGAKMKWNIWLWCSSVRMLTSQSCWDFGAAPLLITTNKTPLPAICQLCHVTGFSCLYAWCLLFFSSTLFPPTVTSICGHY